MKTATIKVAYSRWFTFQWKYIHLKQGEYISGMNIHLPKKFKA